MFLERKWKSIFLLSWAKIFFCFGITKPVSCNSEKRSLHSTCQESVNSFTFDMTVTCLYLSNRIAKTGSAIYGSFRCSLLPRDYSSKNTYIGLNGYQSTKVVYSIHSKPEPIYSWTSMTRTLFGPWKHIRDMGSSSHWGFIMAPGQKTNGDNLEKSFRSSIR